MSHRFQRTIQHYRSGVCVQYDDEEEYLRIMHLREQAKIAEKLKKERERWTKQDGVK